MINLERARFPPSRLCVDAYVQKDCYAPLGLIRQGGRSPEEDI